MFANLSSQMAYLDVQVPPEIVDNATSGETTVEEGHSVTLTCKARGYPPPKVSWRREQDAEMIVLRDQGNKRGEQTRGTTIVLHRTYNSNRPVGPYEAASLFILYSKNTVLMTLAILKKHKHFPPPVMSREGEELELRKVKRGDMGAYLCIAKNGVTPSVSKRIMLRVTCE